MTSHYPSTIVIGWVALALGAALLGDPRARRLACAGLLCLGLGLAAWRVGSGPAASLDPPASLERGFLVVNAGWLLLGVALQVWAATVARRDTSRIPAWAALVLGTALVGGVCLEFVRAAGMVSSAGAAVGLALGGVLLGRALRAVASSGLGVGLSRSVFSDPAPIPSSARPSRTGAALVGITAAALGPHLSLVLVGVIVGAWAAQMQSRQNLPLGALLATATLLPAYALLATIAGPDGLWMATLPLVPLSPAAESLLAPALLLAGWGIAGLWPFHRQSGGVLSALLGVLLVVRVGVPLCPDGIEQWRPLLAPILVLGIWHGAARSRWSAVAIGSAWVGLLSVAPAGIVGAAVLLTAAFAVELPGFLRPSPSTTRVAAALGTALGSVGGLLALEAALGTEVVYTVLAAVGLAVIAVQAASGDESRGVPPRVDSSSGPVHIAG